MAHATSGIVLFVVKAKDGRLVSAFTRSGFTSTSSKGNTKSDGWQSQRRNKTKR